MKLSRQFTVFGSAVFCVVIFSLYLMLDRGHFDHPKSPRREGTFPKGQLSILQEKIDHLERLLAENNEIISNIRDSVINLSESVKDGQKNPEAINFSQGSVSELFPSASALLAVDSEDCLFALKSGSHSPGVQMLDVYDILPFDNPDGGVWKQGFDITYNENEWDSEPLQVFVVPHSHNDPGWLKTFDDYFRDQTQHILNNMVIKLQEDNRRKFIWSEISYFSKWWDGIDSQKKDAVKRLIKDGQFEIVTGGWVMPDEASSHYFAVIDQMIEGHQWLEKNLDLGSSTDILCHMMPFYSYDIPHTCGPDPKICCQFDFKRLPGGRISCPWRVPPEVIHAGNVQHRAWMILDQYRKKSKLFRTKVLLAPLGDDFRYTESSEWDQQYQNYQKLFDYMNSRPEWHVKAQFGTLSDYFEALRKESNLVEKSSNSLFPVLSGDFFTYADRDHHYWSGYFTSRPFYKHLDRVLESYIRAAEILYSLALIQSSKSEKMSVFPSVDNYKLLTEARRNLGLFQHHDALPGTAKDWVVVDYGTRLFHSIMNVKKVIIDSAHILILKDKSAYNYDTTTPFLKMISFVAHLPPLGIGVYQLLEDESSEAVLADYSIYVRNRRQENTDGVFKIKEMQHAVDNIILENAYMKLWFSGMSGLLEKINTKEDGKNHQMKVEFAWYGTTSNRDKSGAYLFLPDGDAKTNSVLHYQKFPGHTEMVRNALLVYQGKNLLPMLHASRLRYAMPFSIQASKYFDEAQSSLCGYLDLQKKSWFGYMCSLEAQPYIFTDPPTIRVAHGKIFSEVVCFFHHVTHTMRLYKVQGLEGQSVEVSNIVDIRGEYNRELAMRISSDINSQNRFYTDLNGYQIQPRVTLSKLPLQANIYPMTTMAYIQDVGVRLTLHSAQSLGVASLKNGQIEVIMDRRLMQDDNRGLGQGVQDNKITANVFRLLLERRYGTDGNEEKAPVSFPSLLSHMTSLFLNHPVIPMTTNGDSGVPELTNTFSPLMSSMPCDMHIVNLRTIQAKVDTKPSDEAALILHRKGFDCRFSNRDSGLLCSTTQGKIKVNKLFSKFRVESITPTSLSLMHSPPDARNISEINMSSMEINTFRIRLG
ncbi:mannosidase alpha class 2A member 1 [Turdus rufiventris]|nr:mannosidase alpha class 2A member 1 [Turdus rufiventris]